MHTAAVAAIMMSSSVPELVVSYGDSGETTRVDIGVEPSVELSDEQVEDAISRLYSFLKTAFHLPRDNRLTLHETETGRTLSKETFRDPSYVSNFPRYWYLTASNGYTAATVPPVYQSLSMEDSTVSACMVIDQCTSRCTCIWVHGSRRGGHYWVLTL